jgi:predicted Zn-dependent protease
MQKSLPLPVLAVFSSLILAGCSTNTSHSLLKLEDEKIAMRSAIATKLGATPLEVEQALDETPEQEAQTAALVTRRVTGRVGTSEDVEMQNQLQVIAEKLARAAGSNPEDVQVVLLQSNRINAYTPGGGILLINEGLLTFAETEAQVAAVMAHELAHIVLKHPQRQKKIRLAHKAGDVMMTSSTPDRLVDNLGKWLRIGGRSTMNGMIRQQEMMADAVGLSILVEAGYDPNEMVRLLTALQRRVSENDRAFNAVNGNHPLTIDRVVATKEKIRQRYRGVSGIKTTVKFQRLLNRYHLEQGKQLAYR